MRALQECRWLVDDSPRYQTTQMTGGSYIHQISLITRRREYNCNCFIYLAPLYEHALAYLIYLAEAACPPLSKMPKTPDSQPSLKSPTRAAYNITLRPRSAGFNPCLGARLTYCTVPNPRTAACPGPSFR